MELTYPEVGATRPGGAMPPGYRHVRRRARVGTGERVFAAGARALREWEVFRAAGLAIRAAQPVAVGPVAEGVEFRNGLGVGRLRLWAPCRVVWVADEPGRYGFGIGTLAGHPESGEEAFELTSGSNGVVWFEVRAFSRPARWYSRLGGPIARILQDRVTGRYVRGLLASVAADGTRA